MTQGFCDRYEKLIRDFWWGDEEGQRKVHWMAWERMIKPKRAGGIGFRDMHLFNQALLAKQAWRLVVNPESLCAKVIKAKYYPQGHILDTVFPQSASLTWQGILHVWICLNPESFGECVMGLISISGEISGF